MDLIDQLDDLGDKISNLSSVTDDQNDNLHSRERDSPTEEQE